MSFASVRQQCYVVIHTTIIQYIQMCPNKLQFIAHLMPIPQQAANNDDEPRLPKMKDLQSLKKSDTHSRQA